MNTDLLQSMVRMWFDHIATFKAEYIRAEMTQDLIELCYELELDNAFIESLQSDAKVKEQ